MKDIPICWGFKIPAEKADLARQWFAELKNDPIRVQQFKDFKKDIHQTAYHSWLQTSSQGCFVVEYASSDKTHDETVKFLDDNPTEFIQWCLDWKKDLHGQQYKNMRGLRHVIEFVAEDITEQDEPTASILPILPNKLAETIKYIDSWQRNHEQQMREYCLRLGVKRWQAWIFTIDEQHYLIQYHNLKKDFRDFYDKYEQESSDIAKDIQKFGIECLGVDFSNQDDQQKCERLY